MPTRLTITTSDNGNTGTGGKRNDTDTVAITVTAVNDAPVATADVGAVVKTRRSATRLSPTGVIQAATGADTDVDNTTASLVVSGAVAGTGAGYAGRWRSLLHWQAPTGI